MSVCITTGGKGSLELNQEREVMGEEGSGERSGGARAFFCV